MGTITQYNPYAAVVSGDPSSFDVGLRLPSTHVITLRTTLPAGFPHEPPSMRILEFAAQHPWLDQSQRIVASPELNSWNPSKVLGAVVQAVIGHFSTRPPAYTPMPGPPGSHGHPPSSAPAPAPSAGAGVTHREPRQRTAIPEIPFEFDELKTLSLSELERLTSDNEALTDFVMMLPAVKGFHEIMASTKNSVLDVAQASLAQEADFEALQGEIDVLRVAAVTAAQEHAGLKERREAVMGRYTPAGLARKLEDRAMALDTETEDIVQAHIDSPGGRDFRTFLHDYIEARKVYHRHAAKSEMMRLQPAFER